MVQMAYIEAGTTNLVRNPALGVNTSLWTVVNGTASRVAATGESSSKSPWVYRCLSTGLMYVVAPSCPISGSTAGRTFMGSLDVYADATVVGRTMRVNMVEAGGAQGQRQTVTNTVLVAGWQRISGLIVVEQNDRTSVFPVIDMTFRQAGDTYDLTGAQVEEQDYASPFCPAYDESNVLQPGNQWNGTPHASTSTRTAGELTIPCATEPAAFGCKWSEDGITTQTLYSESLGQVIGDYGSITWADSELTVTTSRRLWIGQVAAFDRVLTPTEQTRLDEIIDANLLDWYV